MSKPVYQMVAMAENGVIGKDHKLPWRIPEEWEYFMSTTARGIMVMGRICAEEFGRAMPDRDMIAITSNKEFTLPGFQIAHSMDEALILAQASKQPGPIWICGGEQIYRETLDAADRLYLSVVHREFSGDTRFPEACLQAFSKVISRHEHPDATVPFTALILEKATPPA